VDIEDRPSVATVLGEGMTLSELQIFLKKALFKPDPARFSQGGSFTIRFDLETFVALRSGRRPNKRSARIRKDWRVVSL